MSTGDTRSPSSSPKNATIAHSHVTIYRSTSAQMQLQLYSPFIEANDKNDLVAIFQKHDQVRGKVILDRSCYHTGCLSISIEGTFSYYPTSGQGGSIAEYPTPARHVFFSSSTVIPVSLGANSPSQSALRDTFTKHRPSASSPNLNAKPVVRSFSFGFDLPRSCGSGKELPPSFSNLSKDSVDAVDVSYKIRIVWEASNAIDVPFVLEVPILFCPDYDCKPLEVSFEDTQSWLEMPLKSSRQMPFRCAVTLPISFTFSRPSYIPYFVVFTTTPRSPTLAQEIAADATISVSLIQQVCVTEQNVSLPTPPITPSSGSDESSSPQTRFLTRIGRSGSGHSIVKAVKVLEESSGSQDKPLPPLPNETFTKITTLQSRIFIGFSRRPRLYFNGAGHPSLENYAVLPDGLHKDKIRVPKNILPSIDWVGLNVKYYLDVSVLVGLDNFCARIPVPII